MALIMTPIHRQINHACRVTTSAGPGIIPKLAQKGAEICDGSAGVRQKLLEKRPTAIKRGEIVNHSTAMIDEVQIDFEPKVEIE